jgi:hypothetical protein
MSPIVVLIVASQVCETPPPAPGAAEKAVVAQAPQTPVAPPGAGRLTPRLYVEALPPALERVFAVERPDGSGIDVHGAPSPSLLDRAREEWDGNKAKEIYVGFVFFDLMSTQILLTDPNRYEANPLPGMSCAGWRVAWSVVGVVALTVVDRLLWKVHPDLARILRGGFMLVETVSIVTNLTPGSTFNWPGFKRQ